MEKVTCEQTVRKLKHIGRSVPAKTIALFLNTDSRAVATALRSAVRDGRVTINYRRGIGHYRFVRLVAK